MASSTGPYHHPAPPQQGQASSHYTKSSQDQGNSHAKQPRTFSFHSDKSRRSSTSKNFSESHDEKESRRLHSKADPTLAISEAEPSVVAAMRTDSTHVSLRSIQHKDAYGNLIGDPDLSNPTRNRWERPLDTIRSFEAAIDGGYTRKSMIRSETDSVANWNRRSSYHPAAQPRFPQDSYYGSRPPSQFGMATPGTARNSYYGGQGFNNGYEGAYGQQAPRQRMSRMQTEPHYQVYGREQQNVYPLSNKDRSYETVTSAAASGNSDPAGYQTDPTSSDNSSIERRSPAKPQQPVNDYGIGFSHPQSYQPVSLTVGSNGQHPLPPPPTLGSEQYGRPAAPPEHNIPRKQPSLLKRQSADSRPQPEKRKSWFARRFSKDS